MDSMRTVVDQHTGTHYPSGLRSTHYVQIVTDARDWPGADADQLEELHALKVAVAHLDREERVAVEQDILDRDACDIAGAIAAYEAALAWHRSPEAQAARGERPHEP